MVGFEEEGGVKSSVGVLINNYFTGIMHLIM